MVSARTRYWGANALPLGQADADLGVNIYRKTLRSRLNWPLSSAKTRTSSVRDNCFFFLRAAPAHLGGLCAADYVTTNDSGAPSMQACLSCLACSSCATRVCLHGALDSLLKCPRRPIPTKAKQTTQSLTRSLTRRLKTSSLPLPLLQGQRLDNSEHKRRRTARRLSRVGLTSNAPVLEARRRVFFNTFMPSDNQQWPTSISLLCSWQTPSSASLISSAKPTSLPTSAI